MLPQEVDNHESLSDCEPFSRLGRLRGYESTLKIWVSCAWEVEWVMPSEFPNCSFTDSGVGGPLGMVVFLKPTG